MAEQQIGIRLTVKDDGSKEVVLLGDELEDTGDKGKAAAKKTTAAWKLTKKTIGGVKKAAGGLLKTIGSVIKKVFSLKTGILALAGTAGLGFLAKKITDVSSKFEVGMTNVSTLLDTTVVDMARLNRGVRDLAPIAGSTAKDLSEGLYQVISAGTSDAAEALFVLEVSAKAAAAGLTETFTSVDAITTVINAYGLAASDATMVSDLMFKTVEQGKTTFEELAQNIGTVISPAKSTGVELTDLFAIIATLTKGGIDTATAMTGIRATLLGVLGSTDATKESAAELGLQWDLQTLQAKGLIGFLRDMRDATGGNAEKMRELVPETRALNAVLTAVGSQLPELIRIQGEMKNATGATQTAFEKQSSTFEFVSKQFGILIDEVALSLGDNLLPVLIDFVELDLTPMVLDLIDWADANSELIASGLDDFLIDVGDFLRGIDFNAVWEGAKEAADFALALGEEIGSLVLQMGSFINKNSELIGQGMDKVFDGILTTIRDFDFEGLLNNISDTVTKIGGFIDQIDLFFIRLGQITDFSNNLNLSSGFTGVVPGDLTGERDIPSFARGTNFVPQTGLALIHRGERVIPAEENRNLLSQTTNTDNRKQNFNFNNSAAPDDMFAQKRMVQKAIRLSEMGQI